MEKVGFCRCTAENSHLAFVAEGFIGEKIYVNNFLSEG